MVEVRFQYHKQATKWSVVVRGVKTPKEAQDAFAAVVATCYQVDPRLQVHAIVKESAEGDYHITPAV